jgi:tetratricopeptide (TPR) repeat protein
MSGQIVYAQSLYECGEFDEARIVFEKALALDPENLIALRTLGDISLQSGNTVEAKKWYTRLLDADPKDAAVIALVAEIEESAEAAPVPTPEEIPGVDEDAGDQAIPYITDLEGTPVSAGSATPVASAASEPPEVAAASEAATTEIRSEDHSAPEPLAEPEPVQASTPESRASAAAETTEPAGLERHYTPEPTTTEPAGLERHYPIDPVEAGLPEEGMGAEGLRGGRQDEPMGAEGLAGTAPEVPETIGAEGLSGNVPPQALAGTTSSRSDDEDALETWTPPPGATVHERKESRKEDRMVSGAGPGPEPFVNETMAQLYLQQGYRQLALKVYYQLAESRPDDQVLKDRIAEIEAADRAAYPDTPLHPQAEATPSTPPEPARPEYPPAQTSRPRETDDTRVRAAPPAAIRGQLQRKRAAGE